MSVTPGFIHPTLDALKVDVASLKHYGKNPRRGDVEAIAGSLEKNGQYKPIVVRAGTNEVLAGNHTLKAAKKLGWKEIAATFVDVDDDSAARIVLVDNRTNDLAGYDDGELNALLASLPDLEGTGFDDDYLSEFTEGVEEDAKNSTLVERFGAPPFTVLDARQGAWQKRKAAWKAMGIESELGREGDLLYNSPQTMYQNWYPVKNRAEQAAGRTLTGQEVLDSPQAEELIEILGGAGGTSIFDPVLCELMYRWFSPANAHILDPWAGGSVRGLVAARLGRNYTGIELRGEQVEANRDQVHLANGPLPAVLAAPKGESDSPGAVVIAPDFTPRLTPVEEHGGYLVKRDDQFSIGGSNGGKVRTCASLVQAAKDAGAEGVITAGSRQSPQVNIVATLAAKAGLKCRVHVPAGASTPELIAAQGEGAEIVRHKAGYNTVIVARAREDAATSGWPEIPFGMECQEAVDRTSLQVESIANLETKPTRIVIPVGSGMSAAGVLAGLKKYGLNIPVLGVQVGAEPQKRLDEYAPGWETKMDLVKSEYDYHDPARRTKLGGLKLDPIYEAKCLPFLEKGDLLWVVGIRKTEQDREELTNPEPQYVIGESSEQLAQLEEEAYDMLIGCPPYYDLEVYSEDERDLSSMAPADFDIAMIENVKRAAARLRPDSYAVFIVGAVRNDKGHLMDMRSLMVRAAAEAGMTLHNDAMLVTAVGTAAVRAARSFIGARTLARTHQDVLVFLKGDRKKAAARMSELETNATIESIDQVVLTPEVILEGEAA